MSNLVFKQTRALIWEILNSNRQVFYWIATILLLDILMNLLLSFSFAEDYNSQEIVDVINQLFYGSSLLLTLYVCSHTELNESRDRKGFPRRLFTLPISSLTLVLVPTVFGLFLIEAVFFLNHSFGHALQIIENPNWVAFRLAIFVLTHQMILWCLDKFGSVRLVLIGIAGFILTTIDRASTVTFFVLSFWGICSFLLAWNTVAAQRSGRGKLYSNVSALLDSCVDHLPTWSARFSSPEKAQIWFEWRRAGFILPLTVFILLLFVVAPLSILVREFADLSAIIFGIVLALPPLLAIAIGKGFSKGDLWSEDMEIPSFTTVRPLDSTDFIIVKLKVAAISTLITWVIVLAFLVVWLLLWANVDYLLLLGSFLWEVQYNSLWPQLAVIFLAIIAGLLLTWRFMVSSFWAGLSKSRRLFVASVLPLVLFMFVGLYSLELLLDWVLDDYTRYPIVVWCICFLVVAKFGLAVWSWNSVNSTLTNRYLVIWTLGTSCMIALAMLIWSAFRYVIGLDIYLTQTLFICIALAIMPLSQLALAPRFLAANRHR